jgi:hypothetical protein
MKKKIKSSGRIFYIFPCVVLCNYKPDKSRQFSGYRDVCLTWHFAVIYQMPMAFA